MTSAKSKERAKQWRERKKSAQQAADTRRIAAAKHKAEFLAKLTEKEKDQ